MQARLIYVMDPMCSWCWGFAPVFEALAKQAEAVGVSTHLVAGGLRAGTVDTLDAGTRSYILEHWQSVQSTTGQPFTFDGALAAGFVYDTEPACRALVSARSLDADKVWPLVKLIQQAFYVDGRDVTQPGVLVELAKQAGLDPEQFALAFDSAAEQVATGADFEWVQNLGIAGFPTVLAECNGQKALLTNGYQPLEQLAPLLARWLEHSANA